MSSFISLHLIILRQGLSVNLELTDRLHWLASKHPSVSALTPSTGFNEGLAVLL